MRKLASIQIVNQVDPIVGADAIERARILGWWVVVKKGEVRPGDKVVYCEIDSLLPVRPEFEFLRTACYKPEVRDNLNALVRPEGFRIKTVKMRGQVSQGICFPLSLLPADATTEEGTDVTELLGIHKYEPPLPVHLLGRKKGHLPHFLPKTDEVRVQVIAPHLERHRGKTFYLTEKLDGTSFSAFLNQDEFGVCGRNYWLDENDPTCALVRMAKELALGEKLRAIRSTQGFNVAVQGELIGPSIQGNKYALRAHQLRIFNVLDIDRARMIDHAEMLTLLTEYGLASVPQLGTLVLDHTVDELVQMSIGTSVLNPKVQREGLVLRPLSEEKDDEFGTRLSFKVINPSFLLKYDE